VINCAGSGSDKIAKMIGDTVCVRRNWKILADKVSQSFKIKPRLGDYLLLNRNQGKYAHCTLFPCPGPLGKGILVQQTLWVSVAEECQKSSVDERGKKGKSDFGSDSA
jgi:glycerol-3-phosphate dehydrogenase